MEATVDNYTPFSQLCNNTSYINQALHHMNLLDRENNLEIERKDKRNSSQGMKSSGTTDYIDQK